MRKLDKNSARTLVELYYMDGFCDCCWNGHEGIVIPRW